MSKLLIKEQVEKIRKIESAVETVFIGKKEAVRTMLIGFLSGLHALIEDVPGVGKTTLARSLAAAVDLDFSRIQFTPDLLPGDILGMTIWDREKKEFVYKPGAIMHQFILVDEINRASPRTQSALLEAMQERSVSIDGRTYPLPEPFFVIATQNPSGFIGAFNLPEAELDRFGISFSIGYPSIKQEMSILDRFQIDDPLLDITPIITPDEILDLKRAVRKISFSRIIKDFIIQIANKTRSSRYIRIGASPRASLHLQLAAQCSALLKERNFVIPEDVIEVAVPVLSHRLILSAESRIENRSAESVIRQILQGCQIPTGLT